MSKQAEDLLEFDVYRIDVGQRVLLSRGNPVPLSPKVFDTLLVLAEQPGRVLQKDYLLKKVWPDSFVEEGSLARNVHTLRRVLGPAPDGQEYIETIPKRGYRFKAPVRRVSEEHAATASPDGVIQGRLAAGGMGEVYRARDTKLGRDVAIKILPRAFTSDPERLARFEREARLLAALNHPNIGPIYGVEDADGVSALVVELVEGATLADRIQERPIPIQEAFAMARQIAYALDAAHQQGIIHRDLKPANIKITSDGVVKVLDFGLAKMTVVDGATSDLTQSLTLTVDGTRDGTILGTAAYMSPEQARGRAVDKRTDIWAFGCVLYEMLAGRSAFARETDSDTVAAVLEWEPDWSALPGTLPANVLRLLHRCLMKDAERRLRDIADARLELEEETPVLREELGGQPRVVERARSTRRLVAAVIGLIVVLVAGGFSWFLTRGARNEPRAFRIDLSPPAGSTFALMSALSPNGRLLAFVAQSHGVSKLWIRPLDSQNAHEIPGSEGARWPFWSPDSRSIGFFGSGKLMRAEISGGQPTTISTCPAGVGASWNQSGTIIFNAVNDGPLMRVAASGGAASQLTTIDQAHENSHRLPVFLPDGTHFLFLVRATDEAVQGIYVGSLDQPHEKRKLVSSPRHGVYAPGAEGRPGYLLWVRNNKLVAQPFDAVRLTLSGEAVPVADISELGLGSGPSPVSASVEDSLVYGTPPDNRYQLTWYARDGKALEVIGGPDLYFDAAISPDGRRIAAFRVDPTIRQGAGAGDYWLLDLKRRVPSRVTFGGANHLGLSWASDSSQFAYFDANGPPNLWMQEVAGNAPARRLATSHDTQLAPDLSPDGRLLLYTENHNDPSSRTRSDLELLHLDESHTIEPYLQTPFAETNGRFSPDGHWIAYTSDEAGRNEIYVQSFPIGSLKFRVSNEGGDSARWRRDGRELFYVSPNGTLMAVAVRSQSGRLQLGDPQGLFKIPGRTGIYDIAPDGQRVLALPPASDNASPSITIVVNWSALLKK